ncbi:MAG: hypothetical protein ACEQSH_00200 [Bacteroidia bacterium]
MGTAKPTRKPSKRQSTLCSVCGYQIAPDRAGSVCGDCVRRRESTEELKRSLRALGLSDKMPDFRRKPKAAPKRKRQEKPRPGSDAPELWKRQGGLCWVCQRAIPADMRGTQVNLTSSVKPDRAPRLSDLGLTCQSCVSRRHAAMKRQKHAERQKALQSKRR